MIKPLLSILIPGVPTRLVVGSKLVVDLHNQVSKLGAEKQVEIIWLVDSFIRTIGGKRQALIDLAQGEYLAFVDDDDKIAPNYIERLLGAIKQNPDVITFRQDVTWNGARGTIEFKLNNVDEPFNFADSRAITHRRPWHVCCWKSTIAKQCKFPDLNWGEDVPWVDQATPLAKTEVHLPEILHIYDHHDFTSESTFRVRQEGK
jgi:glycosyltransferase involved in cell wall biosynthesis